MPATEAWKNHGDPGPRLQLLEPVEPVIRATTVRSDDQDLNVSTHLPVENVVREAWNTIAPNIWRELDPIAVRSFANLDHGCVKGTKITRTKTGLLRLVVSDVFKVLNSRRWVEEVTHLRSAWAS